MTALSFAGKDGRLEIRSMFVLYKQSAMGQFTSSTGHEMLHIAQRGEWKPVLSFKYSQVLFIWSILCHFVVLTLQHFRGKCRTSPTNTLNANGLIRCFSCELKTLYLSIVFNDTILGNFLCSFNISNIGDSNVFPQCWVKIFYLHFVGLIIKLGTIYLLVNHLSLEVKILL